MPKVSKDWADALADECPKPYFQELREKINAEYASGPVYPEKENIFAALHYTPLSKVSVVLLGQDPYKNPGQAHGLSFSVQPGVDIPPSLANIYKEIHEDIGCEIPDHGCLISWAKQGVLLLNTVLTLRAGESNSHAGFGWETFTDRIISILNEQDRPIVFMLWGKPAQRKAAMLTNPKHLVLMTSHPSPLSVYRGFSGCRHFSKANEFLVKNGGRPIDWRIPDLEV